MCACIRVRKIQGLGVGNNRIDTIDWPFATTLTLCVLYPMTRIVAVVDSTTHGVGEIALGFSSRPPLGVHVFRFTRLRRVRNPAPGIRMATDIDIAELLVPEPIFMACAPLLMRLRSRTLGRRGHERLVGLLTQNCLQTGQVDLTGTILEVVEHQWRRCPLRYLPYSRRLTAWLESLGA